MMLVSKAERKYWEALHRIKHGLAHMVNVNDASFRISTLSVALEAGKVNPKGYIRPQRYPELCEAIREAEQARQATSLTTAAKHIKTEKEKKKEISTKYRELREAYERLLEQYLNVVKENFELKSSTQSRATSKTP
ncbi:TPA: hypothetical protein RUY97_000996 [Aeromonas dhakensis]|uniref:hypothetical protein n=1 Tax=Aeromonas TaxID=642 RepID=UPI00289009D9|nr:hypothetical protein [Aeromonas dhakensis]HDX8484135.1 hypothetical protein [Aeromonas dhakensis]HDX8512025.1 hypothetical protein [Aeromonas dhakensis]HDX8638516.1 hypothetical protein [Aeromonas dhakensis]HDZ8903893.1 hypothetical protein [Aeromonas dhakensis]